MIKDHNLTNSTILLIETLKHTPISYIKGSVGGIALELDTNGTKAAEFSIWDYN
jgi:hypothetical protein